MMFFFRIFILFYFILFFLVLMVWRSWLVWKQTGKNPFVLPNDDTAYGLIGLHMKAVMLLLAVFVVITFFFPQYENYFLQIHWMDDKYLRDEGVVVMIFSFIWIFTAQRQMRDSWRIGIDSDQKTNLVTNGLFRYSRNPIFLGMLASLFGLFLVAPCGFTMLILVLTFVLTGIQIRLEEEYLVKMHGQAYLDYKKKVGRWLLFI